MMSAVLASRVNYFERQFIRLAEMRDEQAYHRQLHRRHNLSHHSWGIVAGLELVLENGQPVVRPGFAVDGYGRDLLLVDRGVFRRDDFDRLGTARLDLWLEYQLDVVNDPASISACDVPQGDGASQPFRAVERADIVAVRGGSLPDPRKPPGVPVTALDEPLLDKGIDEVARYVARNPPYQMCFLQEVICCVRDHAETPQPGRRNASTLELTTVGMYLLIDRLLRHLRCGCGECKPDTGVPIGRVLMRRTVFKGKTRCTVVSIDPGFDHRRLLRKDTCRPIAEGMVDLLPYLWQTPAYAQMQLRKQTCAQDVNFEKRTVSMGVNGFDEPMSMLAKQPLSIARADLGRLVAHTIVDPFKDARIAAFSLAN
jgi:hypothetical protein